MKQEEVEQEIKSLEAQQKELEFNFHRLAGAILAYKTMLQRMTQPAQEAQEAAVDVAEE